MKPCKCVSCSISRGLAKGEIPKGLSDMFLLGYHYYAMTHCPDRIDAEWHAEGVDYYIEEILKDYTAMGQIKKLIKIIKESERVKGLDND